MKNRLVPGMDDAIVRTVDCGSLSICLSACNHDRKAHRPEDGRHAESGRCCLLWWRQRPPAPANFCRPSDQATPPLGLSDELFWPSTKQNEDARNSMKAG